MKPGLTPIEKIKAAYFYHVHHLHQYLNAPTKGGSMKQSNALKKPSASMEVATVTETRSAAWMIKEYLRLRASVKKINEKWEKELAPYTTGMETLATVLGLEINRLEGQNIKTEFGTAFRQEWISFRVADREAWMNWVIKGNHLDMLTANVSKEAIKEYMDSNSGEVPPGLNMTSGYKTLVRSPTE